MEEPTKRIEQPAVGTKVIRIEDGKEFRVLGQQYREEHRWYMRLTAVDGSGEALDLLSVDSLFGMNPIYRYE